MIIILIPGMLSVCSCTFRGSCDGSDHSSDLLRKAPLYNKSGVSLLDNLDIHIVWANGASHSFPFKRYYLHQGYLSDCSLGKELRWQP